MIELRMRGLLGNNLFQYAAARILAEDLGFGLRSIHSHYDSATNVPQLEQLLSLFRDAPLCIPGAEYEQPVDDVISLDNNTFDGYHANLETITSDRTPRKLVVDGYFERYEIFQPYKERIRSWFRLAPVNLGYRISDRDIVMHIRRGDFVVFGRAISLSFYVDLLKKLDFGKLYVCGYGIDSEARQHLACFSPIYVEKAMVDDFRFMMGFNRIIQSQSTFSWWAGFLSDANEIHAPLTIPGSNKFEQEFPHIDLRVFDEERYNYVENVPGLERSPNLEDVLAGRHHLSWRGLLFHGSLASLRAGRNLLSKILVRS